MEEKLEEHGNNDDVKNSVNENSRRRKKEDQGKQIRKST